MDVSAIAPHLKPVKYVLWLSFLILLIWLIVFVVLGYRDGWSIVWGSNATFNIFTAVSAICAAVSVILIKLNPLIKNRIRSAVENIPKKWGSVIDSGATKYFNPTSYEVVDGRYVLTETSSIDSDENGLPIVGIEVPLNSFNMDIYRRYYNMLFHIIDGLENDTIESCRTNPIINSMNVFNIEEKVHAFLDTFKTLIRIEVVGETCLVVKTLDNDSLLIRRNYYDKFMEDVWRMRLEDHLIKISKNLIKETNKAAGIFALVAKLLSDTHIEKSSLGTYAFSDIYNEVSSMVRMYPKYDKEILIAFLNLMMDSKNTLSYAYIDMAFVKYGILLAFNNKIKELHIQIENYLMNNRSTDTKAFFEHLIGPSDSNSIIKFSDILIGISKLQEYILVNNSKNMIEQASAMNPEDVSKFTERIMQNQSITEVTPFRKMLPYIRDKDLLVVVKAHNKSLLFTTKMTNQVGNQLAILNGAMVQAMKAGDRQELSNLEQHSRMLQLRAEHEISNNFQLAKKLNCEIGNLTIDIKTYAQIANTKLFSAAKRDEAFIKMEEAKTELIAKSGELGNTKQVLQSQGGFKEEEIDYELAKDAINPQLDTSPVDISQIDLAIMSDNPVATQQSNNPVATQQSDNPVATQQSDNPVATQQSDNPVATTPINGSIFAFATTPIETSSATTPINGSIFAFSTTPIEIPITAVKWTSWNNSQHTKDIVDEHEKLKIQIEEVSEELIKTVEEAKVESQKLRDVDVNNADALLDHDIKLKDLSTLTNRAMDDALESKTESTLSDLRAIAQSLEMLKQQRMLINVHTIEALRKQNDDLVAANKAQRAASEQMLEEQKKEMEARQAASEQMLEEQKKEMEARQAASKQMLEEQKKEMEARQAASEQMVEDHKKELLHIQQILQDDNHAKESLMNELTQKKSELETLTTDKQKLEKSLYELNKNAAISQGLRNLLDTVRKKRTAETIENLKRTIAENDIKAQQLQERMSGANIDATKALQAEIAINNQNQQFYKTQLDQLTLERQREDIEKADILSRLTTINAELEKLKEQSKELESVNKKGNETQQDIARLTTELQTYQRRIDDIKHEYEKKLNTMESQHQAILTKKTKLLSEYESQRQATEDKQNMINEITGDKQKVMDNIEKLKNSYNKLIASDGTIGLKASENKTPKLEGELFQIEKSRLTDLINNYEAFLPIYDAKLYQFETNGDTSMADSAFRIQTKKLKNVMNKYDDKVIRENEKQLAARQTQKSNARRKGVAQRLGEDQRLGDAQRRTESPLPPLPAAKSKQQEQLEQQVQQKNVAEDEQQLMEEIQASIDNAKLWMVGRENTDQNFDYLRDIIIDPILEETKKLVNSRSQNFYQLQLSNILNAFATDGVDGFEMP